MPLRVAPGDAATLPQRGPHATAMHFPRRSCTAPRRPHFKESEKVPWAGENWRGEFEILVCRAFSLSRFDLSACLSGEEKTGGCATTRVGFDGPPRLHWAMI